jgi:hypothetical protein
LAPSSLPQEPHVVAARRSDAFRGTALRRRMLEDGTLAAELALRIPETPVVITAVTAPDGRR